MTDKTDAWMPLWIGAYLADTQHLTRDEHGGYLLLLMAYWRARAPLPDDDKRLAAIVKATPAEWRRLRPTLAEFFNVDGGAWWHKRVEVEMAAADKRKAGAVAKAQAGGLALSKKRHASAPSTAPSTASSTPQAVLGECPTPTPTPTVEEPIGSPTPAGDADDPWPAPNPTNAGLLCRALKQAGFSSVSPSHPTLLALLEAGATEAEFLVFADQALGKRDPFAYLLTVVSSQREHAAALSTRLHRGAMPNKQEAIEQRNRAVGAEWLAQEGMTP